MGQVNEDRPLCSVSMLGCPMPSRRGAARPYTGGRVSIQPPSTKNVEPVQ